MHPLSIAKVQGIQQLVMIIVIIFSC